MYFRTFIITVPAVQFQKFASDFYLRLSLLAFCGVQQTLFPAGTKASFPKGKVVGM
jgi:hypothetical protein